jgi:hypothetical protein
MLMLWYFFDKCGQNSIDKKGKFSNKKKTHTYITHICILYIKKDQEEVQVLDDLIFSSTIFFLVLIAILDARRSGDKHFTTLYISTTITSVCVLNKKYGLLGGYLACPKSM